MNETKLTIVSLRTNCLPFSAPGLKMTCPPPKSGWEMNLWTRSGSSSCAGLPAGFEKFNMPGTWKISGRKTSWLIALRFFGKMKRQSGITNSKLIQLESILSWLNLEKRGKKSTINNGKIVRCPKCDVLHSPISTSTLVSGLRTIPLGLVTSSNPSKPSCSKKNKL